MSFLLADATSDAVVIGGGVAGLTAAVALSDLGLRTIVVEKEPILGGRARSWSDARTGDPVHLGPHVMTSYYPSFLRLLERLGTKNRIAWQSKELLYTLVDGARAVEIRASRLPAPISFASAMRCDPALSARDIASAWQLVRFALGLGEEDIASLDRHDAASVLRALQVSPALLRRYFAFASTSILNVPLERCSAGTLLRAFRDAASRAAAQIGFPAVGLGDLFAPAARDLLEAAGHTVLTSTTVDSVLDEGAGGERRACGVRLAGGRTIRARHVVCTLPPHDLDAILPASWKEDRGLADLRWFEPVPYVSVYLWLDRKIGERQFWARAYDERDLNCDFYDYANIYAGGRERSFVGSNIISAHRAAGQSDEAIVESTLCELRENIAGAAEARVVDARVNRIPLAVVAPHPGFEARRSPASTSARNFVLAGDWTRTSLPSSMESAAVSGWRAAEIVAASEGKAMKLVKSLPRRGGLATVMAGVSRALPWPARVRALVGKS